MFSNNEAENKLIIDSCKNDLLSYGMAMHPKFIVNDFIEAVSTEIQETIEGDNDRLMIFAPPRHGKSFMTSETAPAWFLGKFPDQKVIAASHTAKLAEDMGMIVRDKLLDPVHQAIFDFEGSLAKGKAASDNFRTNAGGQYFGVGVGGTPIGKGANLYIIDDPIRSREDVESEAQRDGLRSWYSSAVLSRLEGKGKIILMHQRWHDEDLAGKLLKEAQNGGDQWRVICFPAIIDEEIDYQMDYLGRDYGEVLVPGLHDKKHLLRLKSTMLKGDWLSMYQQRPTALSGEKFSEGLFANRYSSNPIQMAMGMNIYILVDPADSKKKGADYTAMAVIGCGADGNFYLLDMIRERLDLGERAETLIQLHRYWRPIMTAYEGYGAQADLQYIKYMQESQNYRFAITKLNTNSKDASKERRIERLIPDMRNGRWFFPLGLVRTDSDGNEYDIMKNIIEEEALPFPAAKHDDGLDALSRIYDIPHLFPSGSMGGSFNSSGNKISPW